MALTERSRQEMYQAFEKTIGKEPALTLLEHLPPVGWKDVATKQDLEIVENRLMVRMEQMLRNQLLALAGLYVASIGAILAIARLIR